MIAARLTDIAIGVLFGLMLALFIQSVWFRAPKVSA
jgi:hypothetical protein